MKKYFYRLGLLIISITFLLVSCDTAPRVSKEYLSGKVFEERGYAEDQLSPEEAAANPVFAKEFLTSLAQIEFVDEKHVKVSYWIYSQGKMSSEGTYVVKNNEIILRLNKLNDLFGYSGKMKDEETLVTNGQFEGFKLKSN